MNLRPFVLAVPLLCTLLAPDVALAKAQDRPHARAIRIDTPPRIDGAIGGDAAWKDAPVHDGFVQAEPKQGGEPTEKTQFRIAYDDTNVYVAIDCLDSDVSGIVERLTRRDRDIQADWVAISFDSRDDHNTAFTFQVSAAGVQLDGQVFSDTEFSSDWDAVWQSAVGRDEHGWHAEFAIPLNVLRFSSADEQSWGLQVHRNVSRKREQMAWSFDRDAGSFWGVTRFGRLDGLRGLEPRRTFELRPYVAAAAIARAGKGSTFIGLQNGATHEAKYDAGLDAKIGLTPRLTLDLALNPDFGQVEADQVVLNLSRFEAYFPEKRPFFTEGQDVFATTIQLIYPRRIGRPAVGLSPGAAVNDGGETLSVVAGAALPRLWTAAKVAGELGDGVSVGMLAALVGAEQVDAVDADGLGRTVELAPPRSYGALRARYALGGGKFVGLTATSVNRLGGGAIYRATADHDAYVQAGDLFWRSGRLSAQAQLAVSERIGGPTHVLPDGRGCSEADALTDFACVPIARADGTRMGPGAVGAGLQVRSQYETTSRLLKVEYTGHTARFDANDLGYAPRFNLNELKLVGGVMKKTPDRFTNFRGLFPFFVGSLAMDGTPQYYVVGADLEANFTNFTFASPEQWIHGPGTWDLYETLDGARFESPLAWEGQWQAGTNQAKALSVEANMHWFLALGDEPRAVSGDATVSWQARSNLELSLGPGVGVDHSVRFYGCSTDSGRACVAEDGARHYLFADLDSRYLTATLRSTYTIAPPLSIQVYAQYFLAEGEFSDYREIDTMGRHPEIRRADLLPSTFTGDFDGDGVKDDGFEAANLNANLVLRWEARPGSTLFLVYTRAQESPFAAPGKLSRGPAEDAILMKFVYFVN